MYKLEYLILEKSILDIRSLMVYSICPLSIYPQNNLHMKLYGKSALTSASLANPTIIENPEFLRLREEEKEKAKEENRYYSHMFYIFLHFYIICSPIVILFTTTYPH